MVVQGIKYNNAGYACFIRVIPTKVEIIPKQYPVKVAQKNGFLIYNFLSLT